MTREEAIRHIESIKPYAGRNIKDALDMATKALEQELILDKIRAEIEQVADKQFQIAMGVADLNERYVHIQMENAYRHILNIIDKYKSEGEGEYEDNTSAG